MAPENNQTEEPSRGMPNTLSFLTECNGLTACISIRPAMLEMLGLPHGSCVLVYAANKNVYIFTGPLPLDKTRTLMSQPFVDMDGYLFHLQAVEKVGCGFQDMNSLTMEFLHYQDGQLNPDRNRR